MKQLSIFTKFITFIEVSWIHDYVNYMIKRVLYLMSGELRNQITLAVARFREKNLKHTGKQC